MACGVPRSPELLALHLHRIFKKEPLLSMNREVELISPLAAGYLDLTCSSESSFFVQIFLCGQLVCVNEANRKNETNWKGNKPSE
mmetsp:Transcript_61776/g.70858  ORF Transcript_61776/g.70858 Transcript_61776/m.70858 type:complete len:85 (+) Transcript_61776:1058-1312(+)